MGTAENITKPSMTRLARKAGIKSLSDDCYSTIRDMITMELSNTIDTMLIVNSEHNTKTIMPEDVYEALRLQGENIASSYDLGTNQGCTTKSKLVA